MSVFKISGGKSLKGEINLSGAKNAASKMMIASLLTDEPVRLKNVPRQYETDITEEIVHAVGSQTHWTDSHTLELHASTITATSVTGISRKNRISILAIAPLLHRAHEVFVPRVGGDAIGPRPTNFHIEALKKMGAQIIESEEGYHASMPGRLQGALI